jgi:CheY-like chemotaxis protein
MYQVAFRDAPCTFIHAIDGEEGIAKAHSEHPDLILLDLVLPKKSGFAVLEEIKKDTDLKDIPVICVTVLHQDEDRLRCERLGAVNYFVKSNIPPEHIVERVVTYLNGETSRPSATAQ